MSTKNTRECGLLPISCCPYGQHNVRVGKSSVNRGRGLIGASRTEQRCIQATNVDVSHQRVLTKVCRAVSEQQRVEVWGKQGQAQVCPLALSHPLQHDLKYVRWKLTLVQGWVGH